VTVTGMFKLVFRKNIEGVCAVINDFKSLKQLRLILQKVSTTNQEKTIRGGLNVLEIVFKPCWHVDCSLEYFVLLQVVLVNCLRVTFKNVHSQKFDFRNV